MFKKRNFFYKILILIFLFVIFSNFILADENEENLIDIEKIEIFVPSDESITLNFEPIDDDLLVQDLQLKENFIESKEQLNINIFSFSYNYNNIILRLSYIILNSFDFFLDSSFYLNNSYLNLNLSLLRDPESVFYNDKILFSQAFVNFNFLRYENLIISNDSKIFYNNLSSISNSYNLYILSDNFKIYDYLNHLNFDIYFIKNNFQTLTYLNIYYAHSFLDFNIYFNFIYNNFYFTIISVILDGYFNIDDNINLKIFIEPYYTFQKGFNFKSFIDLNILKNEKKFIFISAGKTFINNISDLNIETFNLFSEENNFLNFLFFNDYKKVLTNYYFLNFSIFFFFEKIEINIKIFEKYFTSLSKLTYYQNKNYLENIELENINQIELNSKIIFYFDFMKDSYLYFNLYFNILSKKLYDEVLKLTLSFVSEKEFLIFNKTSIEMNYVILNYSSLNNNLLYSIYFKFILIKDFGSLKIFTDFNFYPNKFYLSPFYTRSKLFFRFGIVFKI
jgi:hypothetical protein